MCGHLKANQQIQVFQCSYPWWTPKFGCKNRGSKKWKHGCFQIYFMFTPKKMIQIDEHMFLRTQNWFVCFLASPVEKYVDKNDARKRCLKLASRVVHLVFRMRPCKPHLIKMAMDLVEKIWNNWMVVDWAAKRWCSEFRLGEVFL